MTDLMLAEKDRLTQLLSDQYSKNIINIDEYEKMAELLSKADTSRDLMVIDKMAKAYSDMVTPIGAAQSNTPEQNRPRAVSKPTTKRREYVSVFSSREISIYPTGGHAGDYVSVFGNIQVTIEDLPPGKTKLNAEAVFGSVEIYVPDYVKVKTNVTPVFGGVFTEKDKHQNFVNDDRLHNVETSPELYIKGDAVFGSISVKQLR